MNEQFETVLTAARQLPPVQQQLLAQRLLEEAVPPTPPLSEEQQVALAAVEKTKGTIKGLDRETIIWLAEDEELCGY